MLDDDLIRRIGSGPSRPDRPVLRGTAQNPDTFFQAREACNAFYDACPGIVQETMDQFARAHGPATTCSTTSATRRRSGSSC